MLDELFKDYVINKKIPIPYILNNFLQYNSYSYSGKVFCPFHDNFNTPSAKIYKDKDGDSLFCFSERKVYKASDFFKRKVINYEKEKVFNNIWKRLSEQEKRELYKETGTKEDKINKIWYRNEQNLSKYKERRMSIQNHIEFIYRVIKTINEQEQNNEH